MPRPGRAIHFDVPDNIAVSSPLSGEKGTELPAMVESNLPAHDKSHLSGGTMATPRIRATAIALFALMMLGGCSHKLVATEGQGQVSIYPDEDTYRKLEKMKAQGGVAGMLSGMGENLATGKLDNQTPVKIISSDDLGSNIEVSDGPSKGMKGFVPKANVD
jgi:hypothetical protein